jgi:hypothetical protein
MYMQCGNVNKGCIKELFEATILLYIGSENGYVGTSCLLVSSELWVNSNTAPGGNIRTSLVSVVHVSHRRSPL